MKKIVYFLLSFFIISYGVNPSLLNAASFKASCRAKSSRSYFSDPVYCYRTLEGVDCFSKKIGALEGRLVAFYPIRPSGVLVHESVDGVIQPLSSLPQEQPLNSSSCICLKK